MRRCPPVIRHGLVAGLALLAGCAPVSRPPAPVTSGARIERFQRALDQRERRTAFSESEATMWVRGDAFGRLPAVQAVVSLARPDAFRARAESMFGTAFDLALAGDSLRAVVPSRRIGTALDARRDSIAIRRPGSLAVRVWSATWRPPSGAWANAGTEDSLVIVRWTEGSDSVALAVGASGLPARVRYRRAEGGAVTAEYRGWEWREGVWWPTWIEAHEEGGALSVTTRTQRVRFLPQPPEGRLAVRAPAGSRWLGRGEIVEMLENLGDLR